MSWDEKNTKLHVPLTLLMLADMRQTLEIAKHPEIYHEKNSGTNWYLGDHPDKNRVYEYFAISYAVNTAIAYILPKKYSYTFQGFAISERAYVVIGNYAIGIKIKI